MMGYLANPDLGAEHVAEIEGKTKEAIDGNGWLHSGDKGCIDAQGMFRITGRERSPQLPLLPARGRLQSPQL